VASILSPMMTDISGNWVPVVYNPANCTEQQCGDGTSTIRTTFQLRANVAVEKVLMGTGNCTDLDWMDALIMVVESFGKLEVDLEAMDNDSFPINFSPEPQMEEPEPEPEPEPEHEPEPIFVPSINPAPEVNPGPAIITSPDVNPVPEVNPAPSTAQDDGLSPAELNPAPYIVNPLIPIPTGVFPEPEESSGNFSIWLHVILTPAKFHITILDEDEDEEIFIGTENGCMPPLQYWRDQTFGCPCNGNWFGNGTYNESSETFEGGREIVPKDCPSSLCPETFFLNDTVKYGNARMNVTVFENGTLINKTLEITKMSPIKEIGYAFGAADVVYLLIFKNMNENQQQQTPVPNTIPEPEREANPAPYIIENPDMEPDTQGNSGSPLPLATTITMIFVFLLMMHENTQ